MSSRLASFLDWCQEERAKLVTQVAHLEAGTMRLGMRSLGGDWQDITQDEAKRHWARLAELNALILELAPE